MSQEAILLTGATGFIGRRLVQKLISTHENIYALVRPQFMAKAAALFGNKGSDGRSIHPVQGDVMRRGLLHDEAMVVTLRKTVTKVVHLAAAYDLTISRPLGMAVNVGGTENILDFCESLPRLERFVHVSSIAVSGRHPGLFTEDDLDKGQTFRNAYDETKFLAEKLVRGRMDHIPTIICRPTVVVGDSQTGEIDRVDGHYYALRAIANRMHMIMPQTGITKCHAVPVDFVVDAMAFLIQSADTIGKTYCIGDPHALPFSEFIEKACLHWPCRPPVLYVPPRMVEMTFGLPGVAKMMGIPKESFAYTYIPVEYTFDHLMQALGGTGLSCPSMDEYLPVMVDYFKRHRKQIP